MEKTAIAQLIEWMETPAMQLNDGLSIKKKATDLLELEKNQIRISYHAGYNNGNIDTCMGSEEFYFKTFNNEVK